MRCSLPSREVLRTCAGTTMFPGIADRMNKEITARAPTSMKVKVRRDMTPATALLLLPLLHLHIRTCAFMLQCRFALSCEACPGAGTGYVAAVHTLLPTS